MLKIVPSNESGGTTLHLEGQVVGPWVGEPGRVGDSILSTGVTLVLELSSVSFVGREGVPPPWRLRDEQVTCLNCSRFVAEQVKDLSESAT